MGKFQIVINKFKPLSDKSTDYYVSEMKNHPYSDETGWGYTDVMCVGDTVKATLQKRVSTSYSIWNEVLQRVERQSFQIVVDVYFELDFQHHLFIAEGTNTQLNRVKQSFRQLFWNGFVYEEIFMLPADYLSLFSQAGMLVNVGELTINDFQYDGCLIGRYVAKPVSQSDVMNRLSEYDKKVIRVKMLINLKGEEGILTVTNKGVLSLDASEDAEATLLDYLKLNIE